MFQIGDKVGCENNRVPGYSDILQITYDADKIKTCHPLCLKLFQNELGWF